VCVDVKILFPEIKNKFLLLFITKYLKLKEEIEKKDNDILQLK